jgi:hypothetical protein
VLGGQGQSALQEWLRWNVCHAQLAESILHPERLKEIGERTLSKEAIQRMWPIEVAQKGFIDFLRQQYDHTQLEAIEVIHSPLPPYTCQLKPHCSQFLHWGRVSM